MNSSRVLENTNVMVLAAGLGTRLRPLTDRTPKPVLPIRNRPIMGLILDSLVAHGAKRVVYNTFHLGDRVQEELARDGWHERVELVRSHEEELLGTAGGIRHASQFFVPGAHTIIMNGDVLFSPEWSRAVELHERTDAWGTMIVRTPLMKANSEQDAPRTIHVRDQKIHAIFSPDATHAFTGAQILSPAAVQKLPPRGCVVRQGYVDWLSQKKVLSAWVDEASWCDIGTPEEYEKASRR